MTTLLLAGNLCERTLRDAMVRAYQDTGLTASEILVNAGDWRHRIRPFLEKQLGIVIDAESPIRFHGVRFLVTEGIKPRELELHGHGRLLAILTLTPETGDGG